MLGVGCLFRIAKSIVKSKGGRTNMENKALVGKVIRDTKDDYVDDIGVVSDIRKFEKANKTYAVVKWSEDSKHGNGVYRNYKPKEIGKRFEVVD